MLFTRHKKMKLKAHTHTPSAMPPRGCGEQGGGTQQLLFTPKMWSDLWAGEGESLRGGVGETFGPDSASK